jgi:hypothetical protein
VKVQHTALLSAMDSCNGNGAKTKGKGEVLAHAISQTKKTTKKPECKQTFNVLLIVVT